MPGLSVVILRQIIHEYDLMGSVKSAGRHCGLFSKKYLQNAVQDSQIMNFLNEIVNQDCISKWST